MRNFLNQYKLLKRKGPYMIKLKQPVILNAHGQPIELTARERYHAEYTQRLVNERFGNDLGYEVSITTLTTIVKKITEQKFFEIPPADYLPVRVGEGTWSSNLTTYRSFDIAAEFETGIINTGGQNSRLATADAGVDSLNIKVFPWAKSIGWSIFDLEFAAKSGNWDLVSAKEKARKRNWDLGIQRVAFLGARGQNGSDGNCLGLLNQPGVTANTTVITKAISAMTPAELKVFAAAIVEAYRSNCQRTAWPTHFIIPESDYNGLASQASPEFPIKSTLQLLEETFQIITRKKDFKILPLAYGDAAYHTDVSTIAGKQVYCLLNYDEESVRMDIPLDYTNTLANSLDNFSFQNAGYGQFTGVLAYRPLEMLYFTYNA
jgi:hypothetical protein